MSVTGIFPPMPGYYAPFPAMPEAASDPSAASEPGEWRFPARALKAHSPADWDARCILVFFIRAVFCVLQIIILFCIPSMFIRGQDIFEQGHFYMETQICPFQVLLKDP
jgi:hypothetical protein